MKKYVNTFNAVEGFHNYPSAPDFCVYLAARHRHIFEIRCSFEVDSNNRQIEINKKQRDIEDCLKKKFGYPCEFNSMSCEDIAEYLVLVFGADSVTVLEDGYGGATLTR